MMTFEEAKKVFLNRGYIEVPGGTYYDADKWRESITVISKWLEQQPCDDAVSRECNNCAYYANGANDEACDGCFEDVYEHPNFKPKARHCDDAVSRCAVLDTLDKMDKALDDDRSVKSYKELLTECYKDLTPVIPKEKTKWTLVGEELPKPYEEVIVTDIETSDTYISRYIGNGYWECDNGLYQNRIIAWQPKPKPYKVESEDKE